MGADGSEPCNEFRNVELRIAQRSRFVRFWILFPRPPHVAYLYPVKLALKIMPAALPLCLLDGKLVALAAARISPLDRGFLFGDGIYEVVPCYAGRPFRLEAHLNRLATSLDAIGIADPYPRTRWYALVDELIGANGGGDLGLYLEVTRGAGDGRDFLPRPGLKPTVFGFVSPLSPPTPAVLENGLIASTLEDIRWLRCDVKSVALLGAVLLRMESERRGSQEAILVRNGHLAEGSSSAVFIVLGDELVTPPASRERLPSITRLVVGDVLRKLGITLVEREVPIAELGRAKEIWVASALREVMPVTRLDGKTVGEGRPGPLWRRAFDAFQALKKEESSR